MRFDYDERPYYRICNKTHLFSVSHGKLPIFTNQQQKKYNNEILF